jgi:ABC-type molybdate transport system substrate-binding protein
LSPRRGRLLHLSRTLCRWLGIVYSTDATAGFKLVVPLPLLDQPPIEYVVAQARDPQSDTQSFMAFVKSAAAQAAFKSAGLAPIDDAQASEGGK